MFSSNRLLSGVIVVGLAVTLSGCGPRSAPEKQTPARPNDKTAQEQSVAESNSSSTQVAKGLAELSDADAAIAKTQRICPVSGDVLGEMGKPYKVTIEGKTIFLCCPGCEKELRENPQKYLAKIEKGMVDGSKSLPVQGK